MVKPMKYRKLVGLLREAGFTPTQGKGDHEKWRNGTTWTIITQTAEGRQGRPRRNREEQAAMNSLIVTATRWSGGWELEIGEQQHTQVRNLCNARQQVVDYLDTMDESVDHADVDITIIPEIGALADEVAQAREATRAAAEATEMAARQSRAAAQHLRAAGYSVSDSAVIMGVSRGRVSQLVNL